MKTRFLHTALIAAVLLACPQVQAEALKPIHRIELGAFGGVMLPSNNHELYDVGNVVWRQLKDVAPEVGIRFGYLPYRYLGAEFEASYLPTDTSDGAHVNLYTVRAHLLGQYPWIVTPFLVVGGGLLGIASKTTALGSDVDGAFYYGAGLKYDIRDWLVARFDFRHNITNRYLDGGLTSHFEFLGGFSFVLSQVKPAPADRDGDGIPDDIDACPDDPAPGSADGCPPPPDRDGDGIPDDLDACPDVPGPPPDGCPPPPDRDGDGIPDDLDACPDEPGPPPDGCPPAAEPEPEPEPEDVPEPVKQFTGTIAGITFALNKAEIQPSSQPVLDRAAAVLAEYPELRVKVRGHTDSTGDVRYNEQLSLRRAESVRNYLVSKGITSERIDVEGVGPAEPIADNKTAAGRAQNRRIEFTISRAPKPRAE